MISNAELAGKCNAAAISLPNYAIHENIVFNHSDWNTNCCTKVPKLTEDGGFLIPEGVGLCTEWNESLVKEAERYVIE